MLYPGAVFKPVVNHGGQITQKLGLVLHVQQGNNSLYEWFNNPSSEVSSHFWVGKLGEVEQYVDCDLIAWAQMAGNSTYLSVETEGYVTEDLTADQINSLAKLYRWCHDTFNMPFATSDTPGQPGLAWHGMGGAEWGGHTGCPGSLRLSHRTEILQRAAGAVISPSTPPPVSSTQPPAQTPPSGQTAPPFPGVLLIYTPGKPMVNGIEVRQWQQQMAKRGWKIIVDGFYGPSSEVVCKQFQQEKGLTSDGIVGPKTWAATWEAPIT